MFVVTTLESFRFQDEDDYENEVFSKLVVRVREQARIKKWSIVPDPIHQYNSLLY